MIIKINVTKDDINNGVQKSSSFCPIALATKRAFEELKFKIFEIEVDSNIKVSIEGNELIASDPRINEFIDKFDNGKEVNEFELELNFMEYYYDYYDEVED